MSLNKKLNDEYLNLHTKKEESFWSTYMNHSTLVDGEFEKLESELRDYISDGSVLGSIRAELAKEGLSDWERTGLEGWKHFFECNSIEDKEALEIQKNLIFMEGELGRKRRSYSLGYKDPESGEHIEAGSGKLSLLIGNDKNESKRKAAWQGLRDLETFVLDNGYIELVKERNRLGKRLGYDDYYDYRTSVNEGISKKELFNILDELKDKTSEAYYESIKGMETVGPWNIRYLTAGDLSEKLEPYFAFDQALLRWGKSFNAMGIDFRKAHIQIDLVARKGKYENGFMHGPFPPYNDEKKFLPAKLNFSANAVPGQTGGGIRAINTLMHEGGHAAHFSNIDMPSPCYSQEFAPTSGGFAEIQSMLLDSILADGDWIWKYAEDKNGNKVPDDLIKEQIETEYRFLAFTLRYLAVVPYAEKKIYELSDEDLTSENILAAVREAENNFFGFDSPRPTLAVPHLLSGESAAGYHVYVLAIMGVYQTKKYLLKKYGRMVDNKEIGKELCEKYWKPGNSKTFIQFIKDMTGEDFSAAATVELVNKTLEDHVKEGLASVELIKSIPDSESEINLNCSIKMVHGDQLICTSEDGFAEMCEKYSRWYQTL
ncbi:MAG: M3 family metallopeptidase [Spirochaetaceae bacterium]|jgi:oligoendopeptidase F|nr:M3 family metallopeptidase [Spirochaetaceae bacterium]